jgi:hypothetical protein
MVLRALRSAASTGLLVAHGTRLRWRQALARDAVLATLLPPEQAVSHGGQPQRCAPGATVAEIAANGLPIVGRDLPDEDGAFARQYHLGGAGAVLVRPGVRRLASFRAAVMHGQRCGRLSG